MIAEAYTFTLKGQTYTTSYTDGEVQERLEKLRSNNFADSLWHAFYRWGRWTPNQRPWAYKLVLDAEAKTNTSEGSTVYLPTVARFLFSVTTLKRMKLVFQQTEGTVVIKKSQSKPVFWITYNSELVASLREDGSCKMIKSVPGVFALLDELEANPETFAANYGRKTGVCCFCGIPLTDSRSTEVGYGPICAGHYNLPWGNKKK